MNRSNNIVAFLLLFASTAFCQSTLSVKKTIGNGAILQRNVEIPIKGWAKDVQNLEIRLDDNEYKASVNKATGEWKAMIPPTEAGGPHKLTIEGAGHLLTYEDIYFGDVWLCSGQSNMEWVLKNTDGAEDEIANASDPLIRQFKVPHSNAETPNQILPGGEWKSANPETAGNFTAVGYYFAKELRKSQNVPIGLLNSSWGGSRIEPWISKETLDREHPNYSFNAYAEKNSANPKGQKAKMLKLFPGLTDVDQGMKDGKPLWVGTDYDESKWKNIEVHDMWESQGFSGVDGIAWYRTTLVLSKEQSENDITLNLGAIDDSDQVWINGKKIGETNGYDKERNYIISTSSLKQGENILVIRVEDTGGGGGLYKGKFTQSISTSSGDIQLTELAWLIRFSAIQINTLSNHIPNLIYNAMIHPIIDFPVKGVIWYQGESNAGDLQTAFDYRYHMRTLISEWRQKWSNPELPFLYVSLANFRAPQDDPKNDGWAIIRESMTDVLKVSNTGQAIIIDIGEQNDIHPRNKKDVGYRLALPARKIVYGENVVSGSPMYSTHTVEGNKMTISFKEVGKGLRVNNRYGYVNGFSIAGKDKKFYWAEAKLENGKVTVWNENVKEPMAVRYAWETNPFDVNLVSEDGLPVTPFRTDDWKVTE